MAQLNEAALRAALQELAKRAKSDLAWLAANHVFFKSSQEFASASAASILSLPEHNIRVPVEQFASPEEARRVWKQAVEAFHELRPCALRQARDEAGGYLNKAAVVYAVAIVEGFLSDAYKATWKAAYKQNKTGSIPASVRSFVAILGCLRTHRAEQKKGCYVGDKFPENSRGWARDALFLAEIRNAIVHNQGRLDSRFLKAVGWCGCAEPLWDKEIWTDREAFRADFIDPPDRKDPNEPVQVCLDLTKVIIPYMPKCVAFIDAAIEKLIGAAKCWPAPRNVHGETPRLRSG